MTLSFLKNSKYKLKSKSLGDYSHIVKSCNFKFITYLDKESSNVEKEKSFFSILKSSSLLFASSWFLIPSSSLHSILITVFLWKVCQLRISLLF